MKSSLPQSCDNEDVQSRPYFFIVIGTLSILVVFALFVGMLSSGRTARDRFLAEQPRSETLQEIVANSPSLPAQQAIPAPKNNADDAIDDASDEKRIANLQEAAAAIEKFKKYYRPYPESYDYVLADPYNAPPINGLYHYGTNAEREEFHICALLTKPEVACYSSSASREVFILPRSAVMPKSDEWFALQWNNVAYEKTPFITFANGWKYTSDESSNATTYDLAATTLSGQEIIIGRMNILRYIPREEGMAIEDFAAETAATWKKDTVIVKSSSKGSVHGMPSVVYTGLVSANGQWYTNFSYFLYFGNQVFEFSWFFDAGMIGMFAPTHSTVISYFNKYGDLANMRRVEGFDRQ